MNKIICWTDSMDCVYWINSSDKIWERFVQNRTKEIRENVPGILWNHCPGKYNPADIPSRGTDISKHDNSRIWLHGPDFLSGDESCHFKINSEPGEDIGKEVTCAVIETKHHPQLENIIKLERFSKLRRVLARSATFYVL